MITPTQLTVINSLLDSSPDSITAIEAGCIRSILSDLAALDVENARLWNEIDGWKIRYNETSRIIGNLRRENEGATLAVSEIENIGQLIGCNHTEGLSKCVREKIETIEVENARLRKAIETLMVPFNESIARNNGGLPSGVYVQRFRFEQARKELMKESAT